ncbi:MAG: alpha/beta hydrolase [Chitinophagaceae bacterium]|nr:MAG: alpha/beta hydrolase [Chitinophagaceae bacterium]
MKIKKPTISIIGTVLTSGTSINASAQSIASNSSSILAVNQYIQVTSAKIAYRVIGQGDPILLCNRLRGIMDTWDPAFVDELAKTNKVIIFDYPGIGLSTGKLAPTITGVATSVADFAKELGLQRFKLAGWSYGGAVAQTIAAEYPNLISHLVLIGANPPGKNDTPMEQAFLDAAFKPVNDLADEEVLFFEPSSAKSRAAAKLSRERILMRTKELSIMVPPEKFQDYFKGIVDFQQDANHTREKLAKTKIPILILMGDHDPSCPIENWFPLVKKWRTAQLVIIPDSGHGVQHEFPEMSVAQLNLFLKMN